jgi:hypothetical protein
MITEKRYTFTRQTLKFCIAGFLIPGFTAIAILGLQMGIVFLGLECASSWTILWVLTTVGLVLAPIVFVRRMYKTLETGYHLPPAKLITFNVVEYIFVQATLAAFFTNGRTLCYATDGQNGLEFVLTGWMALPPLILLSFVFDKLHVEKIATLREEVSDRGNPVGNTP